MIRTSVADGKVLRRIAQSGGVIVTRRPSGTLFELRRGDSGGSTLPAVVIKRLIQADALIADDRGLFDDPQSYRARLPRDGRWPM